MAPSEEGTLKSLELAIQTEMDGKKFYEETRDRASNPLAKAAFTALAREELDHLRIIHRFHRELQEKGEWPDLEAPSESRDFAGVIKTVFQEAMEHVDQEVQVDGDALEGYKMAMDLEQRAYSMYRRLKSETTDDRARTLYEFMEIQENQHYTFLEDSFKYLSNPLEFFDGEHYPHFEGA